RAPSRHRNACLISSGVPEPKSNKKIAGLSGHDDGDQIAYSLRNGLILVTSDRDYLDERRHPIIHCPAIFLFDFGFGTPYEMRQAFRCLEGALSMPQFYDKWWKVDAKRDCWRSSYAIRMAQLHE